MYKYFVYMKLSGVDNYRLSSQGTCKEFILNPDADPSPEITEFLIRNANVGPWTHIIWEINPTWMVVVKDENNEIVYSSFENNGDAPERRRNPKHGLQLYDDYGCRIDTI